MRGVGLYLDGEARRDHPDILEPGRTFLRSDMAQMRWMWEEAKRGGQDSFVWLGLSDPSDDEFHRAADVFGIDALEREDALSTTQRARIDIADDHVFTLFKVLAYVEETSDVETGQIAVFVGPSFVLSARMGDPGDLSGVRAELESAPERLRLGPMAVLHGILDVVVDGYEDVVQELAQDIDQVEERVFSPARSDDAMVIYKLKRENLEVRRALDPLRPVADRLFDQRSVWVPEDLRPYYRDLADHLLHVAEVSAQHDTLLGDVLEAARTRTAVQQNDDMRKISAYVALAAVPTMIAGIYGMNFDTMPELRWDFGYPAVLVLMLVICGLLYRAFKRSGWL
jgi:magnesium transporter